MITLSLPVILIIGFIVLLLVLWKYWGKEWGSEESMGSWSRWESGISKMEQANKDTSEHVHRFDNSDIEKINAFFQTHDSLRSLTSKTMEHSCSSRKEVRLISTHEDALSAREDEMVSIFLPAQASPKPKKTRGKGQKGEPKRSGRPRLMNRGNGPESNGEAICRDTLESVYGVPFRKAHPDWLQNPETGGRIELDCYNEDLKIAVEYNGIQHYKWPNGFPQSLEQFQQQLRRDEYKKRVCKERDIYFIVVPYTVPLTEIPNYLYERLPENIDDETEMILEKSDN